jgi:histidinol-phosphate phosphatase family protein
MTLKNLGIDSSWTLFLDRDGVLNRKRDNDYVKTWEEFEILPGVLQALAMASSMFSKVVVVTNQQGVGKGLYTSSQLEAIHNRFQQMVKEAGGRIDRFYYCPALDKDQDPCRKPNTGMALQAKKDFPSIVFEKSFMVGDSASDMEMGARLQMKNVYISSANPVFPLPGSPFVYPDFLSFTEELKP